MTHGKKQESLSQHRKEKKVTETAFERKHMLNLVEKTSKQLL